MMQSGQPKKPDPVYEEKLAEMERKYGVILQRIQTYDVGLADKDRLKSLLEKYEENLNAHVREFVHFKSDQEKSLGAAAKILNEQNKKNETFQIALKNFPEKLEDLRNFHINELGKIGKSIDSLNEKLNHIGMVIVDKDQMEQIMKHVLDQIELVDQGKKPLVTEIDRLKLDFYKLTESLRNISEMPSVFQERLQTIAQAHEDFKNYVNGLSAGLESRFDAALKLFKAEHEKKLAAMKEEILGTPTSNAKVKAELEQKMQMAQLDGANAVIKANNVESQIKLLEKKLENLQLQVKRNELSK